KPVPPAGKCLNESRGLGRVAQHFPQSSNGIVKTVVEVHKRIDRPDLGAKVLASHEVTGALQQDLEHLQGLALQAEFHAVFAKLAGADIEFKGAEPQYTRTWCGCRHINVHKFGGVYHNS